MHRAPSLVMPIMSVLTSSALALACSTSSPSSAPPHAPQAKSATAESGSDAAASRTVTTAAVPPTTATIPFPTRSTTANAPSRGSLDAAYRAGQTATGGKNADYIPSLAKVNSKLFGIAVVGVNGETMEIGDSKHPFAVESVSKVFTLTRVLEDSGPEKVEKGVGTNATGMPFNSIIAIEMNDAHRADNPFVNPGAITTVSLVEASSPKERWNKIVGTMNAFAGHGLSVNDDVYRSESKTNTRNRAISWLLKSYDVLQGDPAEMLDVYTRQCSVNVTALDLATMGAVFANGGVHPATGERLVSSENAARVLSVMATNGLYDGSGEWAFRVGIPAKSGVGGGIVGVVPGRYAIAAFSPPLDEAGNSVRAQKAIEAFVKETGGGVYASTPARPVASR